MIPLPGERGFGKMRRVLPSGPSSLVLVVFFIFASVYLLDGSAAFRFRRAQPPQHHNIQLQRQLQQRRSERDYVSVFNDEEGSMIDNGPQVQRRPNPRLRRDAFDPTCNSTCPSLAENQTLFVTVGAYIYDISQLDPIGQNAMVTGYYWLYWNSCIALPPNMFQPYDTLTIDNQSAMWALTIETDLTNTCYDPAGNAYTCPTCNVPREGYSYVDFRFSASVKFTFDYRHYPLDEQEIFIALDDLESDVDRIQYIADSDTDYHPSVNVLGFEIESVIARVKNITARSNYGYYDPPRPFSQFSRAELGIRIKRSPVYFVLKVLPPTLVTLFSSGIILFVDPLNIDTRLGSAITGLLTLVFLAVGYTDKVPEIAEMTIIDWTYSWCYLLVLLIMVECVGVSYYLRTITKLQLKVEMGVALHVHSYRPSIWRKIFCFSKESDPLLEDQVLREKYEEGSESQNDRQERLRAEAEELIRKKHHRARRIDFVLAMIGLFLSTVGTALVILGANYVI